MNIQTVALQVCTENKQQILDLTSTVEDALRSFDVRDGILAMYSQHTTAALFVGEFQPALNNDVLDFLGRAVEGGRTYQHNCPELSDCDRKNAASHLRGLMLGHSVVAPIIGGKLALGQFQ